MLKDSNLIKIEQRYNKCHPYLILGYIEKIVPLAKSTVLVQCDKGHTFETTINSIRSKVACKECSAYTLLDKRQQWLAENNLTLISGCLTTLTHKTEITVMCKAGHIFNLQGKTLSDNRVMKHNHCKECENTSRPGSYTIDSINDKNYNDPLSIYVMHFLSNDEEFWKVGLSTDPDKRLVSLLYSGYEVTLEYNTTLTMKHAILLESSVLCEEERHIPRRKFSGHTECLVKKSNKHYS